MSQTIKLKRGTTTPTTSNIVSGEVAIDTSAKKLYVNDAGTIKEIGGSSAVDLSNYVTLNTTQTSISGFKGFTGNIGISSQLQHLNDSNTYFEFNAADTARIVVGGSQKLVVNSGGVSVSNGVLSMNGGSITSAGGLTVDYTGNRTGDAGILVTNDASDWGIKVDKDGTADYGILSQTDGENAIVVRNAAGTNKIQLQGDGDASFEGTVTLPYLRVTSANDASLSSTVHGIQVGATSGQNLLLDNNEVLSRNNGASSTLHLQADGGTVTVGAGTNANLTVNGTIQGGDFQDYNNTAYYVNPASTSVGFKTQGKIQVAQGAGGRGLEISTTSNWANASFYTPAIRFEQADGTVIAGIRGHRTASGTTTLMLGTDWLNQTLQITSTYGDFAGTNGVRSAIYYDRNNTAYYVDPHSTGTSLNVAGSIIANNNSTITGSGSSGNAFNVYRGSDSASAFRVLNTGEVLVSSNYFYVNASQGAYFTGDVRVRGGISNDGSNYGGDVRIHETTDVVGSVKANSYYDRNDTSYYVDPASVSNVHDITFNGVMRSTNNANVDGPNFNVSTTNKSTSEYAYRVDRSGTVVGGIRINGSMVAAGLTTQGITNTGSLNMSNQQIYGVNNLRFNDAGVNEGIKWDGGNEWQIYESPNTQTNASGNLQFTSGSGNGSRRLTIDTAGHVTATGSSRSPIFYDSDNTSFYTNPASTSRLNDLDVDKVVLKTSDGVRFEHANQIDTNDGRIGAGSHGSGLNIVGVQTTAGTGRQVRIWGEVLTDASQKFWHGGNDGAGSGLDADLLDGQQGSYYLNYNNFTNTPSIPSSSQFVDLTSTQTNISGFKAFTQNVAVGSQIQHLSDSNTYLQFDTDRIRLVAGGNTRFDSNNQYMLYNGMANNADTYMNFRVMRNSNSSSLNDGMYIGYGNSNSGVTRLFGGGATNNGLQVHSGHTNISGSARSPIFYDLNNTAYYTDPHATSRMNVVHANSFVQAQNNTVKVAYPDGGSANFSGTNTGGIKITLPQSWTNTMFMMTVAVYDYSSHESFEVKLGGYNHTSGNLNGGSWHSCFAWIDSSYRKDRNFTVRFGHDGTKCCIQIGETNSTWSYLKVAVTEFFGAHSSATASNWDNSWNVSLVTTNIPISNGGASIDQTDSNRYMQILYDSNNTGYLLDPAGTSRTNQTHADYIGIGAANNSSGAYRLNMGGSIDMNNNSIDYVSQLHFHDNVRFYDSGNDSHLNFKYGHANTGSIRFYNGSSVLKGSVYADTNGFGLLDNDGNWAVRTQTGTSPLLLYADNNAEFEVHTSYTNSPGSSRAPIFYDSNNTTYYANPAGTSQFAALKTGSIIAGSATTAMSSAGQIAVHSSGNPYISFHSGGGTARTGYFQHLTDSDRFYFGEVSFTETGGSFRAPVFYDSNNTGYYVDPSTSGTSAVLNGTVGISSGHGKGFRFWNSDNYKIYMSAVSDATWGGRANGETTSDYNMYFRMKGGTNRGFTFRNNVTNVATIDGAGNGYFNSARATIFYDVTNTGYYLDPSAANRLNNIICDRYRASSSSANMDFEDNNGGVDMRKDPSGNLIVVGNVTAYGSTSDIRLKENIETIPDALEKVKKLDGVTFDYKKDGTRSTGLIAQQLQEVLPEVVYEATDIGEEESHLAVRYGNVVGLLVEAMKEQSAQIDALRAEIESLKGK